MSNALYLIVEGHGEQEATPVLIRRLLIEQYQRYDFPTIRASKATSNAEIIMPGGVERYLELYRNSPDCKGVVVLLDAEREHRACPPGLAHHLAQRTKALQLKFPVVVVCAACEYESWFLYNLHTKIRDRLNPDVAYEGDPEMECGAKGWLARHMPPGRAYKEIIDQPAMTAHIDIPHAVEELLDAIDSQSSIVSPLPPEVETTN